MDKFLLLSLALTLSMAFTPLYPYCDAANTGTKTTTAFIGQDIVADAGFIKVAQDQDFGTHTSGTFICNSAMMYKGDIYRGEYINQNGGIYTQSYTSPTPTQFLDAFRRVMVVKEYTDATKTAFSYGIYSYDNKNLQTPTLTRVTMPVPAGMTFNKILGFNDPNLHMLFTSATKTQRHDKSVKTSGAAQTVNLVANAKMNALGGSQSMFWDSLSSKWIQSSAAAGTAWTAVAPKATTAGIEFGSVMATIHSFYRFHNDFFAVSSYTQSGATVKAYYGWYEGKNTLKVSGADQTGTMVPVVHSSKFNFMFVTTNLLVWMKYDSTGAFIPNCFVGLESGSADYNEAYADFSTALRATFQIEKGFAMTADAIHVYELQKVSGTQKVNKITSITLPSDIQTAIQTGTANHFRIDVKCSCSKIAVTSLMCFSQTLKCFTASGPIMSDCTVAYQDTVGQAV